MPSVPQIEHFDIFEENVRLGNNDKELIDECPPDLLDQYQKAMSELTPELQAQVKEATRRLNRSAFPHRSITVDSSCSGLESVRKEIVWNNLFVGTPFLEKLRVAGVADPYLGGAGNTANIYASQPRVSTVFLGGGQMQSPIIYGEKKRGFINWIADKVRNIVK